MAIVLSPLPPHKYCRSLCQFVPFSFSTCYSLETWCSWRATTTELNHSCPYSTKTPQIQIHVLS